LLLVFQVGSALTLSRLALEAQLSCLSLLNSWDYKHIAYTTILSP
jgi:hypothetical protein